jgi:dolichol-phosphate mannosyltransferase
MKLTIVSPAYNEVHNIKVFVEQIEEALSNKIEEFEIIIVDDNSKDGSKEILKELNNKLKNFRYIIRQEQPRDLSQSCILGFKNAKFENILVLDCDLQHKPSDIQKLINEFENNNYNIVIGARKIFSKIESLSIFRQAASILIILVFNTLLKKYTSDPMSGFFIFKKQVFTNADKFYGKGFKILIDLIYNSKETITSKDVFINFDHRVANKSKMNFKILFYIIDFTVKKFFKRIF